MAGAWTKVPGERMVQYGGKGLDDGSREKIGPMWWQGPGLRYWEKEWSSVVAEAWTIPRKRLVKCGNSFWTMVAGKIMTQCCAREI